MRIFKRFFSSKKKLPIMGDILILRIEGKPEYTLYIYKFDECGDKRWKSIESFNLLTYKEAVEFAGFYRNSLKISHSNIL